MSEAAETGLFLDGLRCAGCGHRVERTLQEAPGVLEATVNFASHRARVRFDPAKTDREVLAAAVEALGYTAIAYDPDSLERPALRAARTAQVRMLVAWFLAGNVMLVALALYLGEGSGMDSSTRRALRWLAIALSLPAATWCAAPFWKGAWSGLRRGELPFDVPVVLGIAVSFVTSIVATRLDVQHVFADSAAMIVFLVLLGRTLERSARARATGAVERLVGLLPKTARRIREARTEEVAAAELVVGDLVVVAPGESFPADGRIRAGETEVDESLVSGESRTRLRAPGDPVIGATRNVLAEVEVEVTAPASGGTLARIAALLERAQLERPQIQRIADRVARVFAPAVVVAAAATVGVHLALGSTPLEAALTAAAVLIVACPCALGLATPAAIAAALGRAAGLGVLFKSGDALERCARIDTLVLDKTGTLTQGSLSVAEVHVAPGVSEQSLVAVAAGAEGASVHPVARALAGRAQSLGVEVPAFPVRRTIAGKGVEACGGAIRILVGSEELLRDRAVACAPGLREAAAKAAARGASVAFVARGDEALGVVAFVDTPRVDAEDAVRRLGAFGVSVVLASGDTRGAVEHAAARTGISDARAELTPEAKVELVSSLRRAGRSVLVAGDGVNDAAALAAGDAGMAFARGADVTVHAADAVIRSPRLAAIPDSVGLARATLRRIRENLVLALGYNAVAVPLAAAGLLTPLAAAIAMSLSSLVVTLNALRLLRYRS
jgi:Cu2+-exporting ATPase